MNTSKLTKRSQITSSKHISFFNRHRELIAAIVSGGIIAIAWIFTSFLPHTIWIALHIIAFIIGGYQQAKEGIQKTVQKKRLNVELLMVIAAIGAAAIGYWTEGAILIFIFSFAGALETYTLDKSEREIASLLEMQPETARIIDNDIEKIVHVSELKIGDLIHVRASERIPADGIIIEGETAVDESAITGESIPITKQAGNNVFAGTIALNGSITIQINELAKDTLFQKIINMVHTAKEEKTPSQLFIEKFEGIYVHIVLIAVVIMMFLPTLLFDWTFSESIYRAMVLLVVSSPCALVASIMPATLAAISTCARNGVLVKGGVHLENVSRIRACAFDKTGTLTNGSPEVTDVIIHPDYDVNYVHEIVGAIENESTHSLAHTLRKYTLKKIGKDHFSLTPSEVKTVSGRGVIGVVNGEKWYIGKKHLAKKLNDANPFYQNRDKELGNQGKTVVYVRHEDEIIALYALKDTVRKEAKETIQYLHHRGIYTIMLTGDQESTAKQVAKEVGINDFVAECMPDRKVSYLKRLKENYSSVLMIGDGINDAPALAVADVGIAMGEGTDVALNTADVVLIKNDLSKIKDTFERSKKMNRIIKQNIFFSLAVIITLIFSNFFQVIDLPLGVIGHEGSTILVILNGLRLLK